jgi:hypothetical protein
MGKRRNDVAWLGRDEHEERERQRRQLRQRKGAGNFVHIKGGGEPRDVRSKRQRGRKNRRFH